MNNLMKKKVSVLDLIRGNSVPLMFVLICAVFIPLSGFSGSYLLNEIMTRLGRNAFLILSLLIPIMAGMGLNFGMTLGAIDAIREYGLSPGSDIIIITVDGEQAAIDLLKAGEINCVVECTPNLGDSVMELAKKLAAGETVPKMSHPDEDVFTEFDDLSDLAPRGY